MSNRTMITEARELLPAARRHVESIAAAHGVRTEPIDEVWPLTGRIENRLRQTQATDRDGELMTAHMIARQADALAAFLGLVDCCEGTDGFDVEHADDDIWADYYVRRVQDAARSIRKHIC